MGYIYIYIIRISWDMMVKIYTEHLGGMVWVCRNVVYDLVYQINGNRTCNMDDNWQSEYDRKQYFHGNIEIWSIVDIWVV